MQRFNSDDGMISITCTQSLPHFAVVTIKNVCYTKSLMAGEDWSMHTFILKK